MDDYKFQASLITSEQTNTQNSAAFNSQVRGDMQMFKDMPESEVNNAVNDAQLKAQSDGIANCAQDSAVRNYARHLLYLAWFNSYGQVTSSSTLGVSETIANPTQSGDGFLLQYEQIAMDYGKQSGGVYTE